MHSVQIKNKAIFFSATAIFLFALVLFNNLLNQQSLRVSAQVESATTAGFCERYQVGTPVPAGYGMPYSSTKGTALIRAWCSGGAATVTLGDGNDTTYVYPTGYILKDGTWSAIEFVGPRSGTWLRGSGSTDIALSNSSDSVILAYICEWDGSWRCGCKDAECREQGWQIQAVGSRYLGTHDPEKQPIFLAAPVPGVVALGKSFQVTGWNFGLEGNDVYLNTEKVATNVPSVNRSSISVAIPESYKPGLYALQVRHNGRISETPRNIIVEDPSVEKPTITDVQPKNFNSGDVVTLTGTGFMRKGNTVFTTLGVLKDISSADGRTLKFTYYGLGKGVQPKTQAGERVMKDWDIYFSVLTDGGMSGYMHGTLTQ